MVNRLIFDENGLLDEDSTLDNQASKGDDGILVYQVSYANYDYTNSFLTVSARLPDGNVIEGMSASYTDIGATKGFSFLIRAPLTAQAGTVQLSFVLRDTTPTYTSPNNYFYEILVSTTINLTVADSAHSQSTTAITYDELEDLQNTIQSNYASLDNKKIDKDLRTYYSLNTNPTGYEEVPLSNGTTITYVHSTRVLNKVDTVNSVTPDANRNVEITSADIPHANTTVNGKFNAIDTSLIEMTNDINNKVSEGNDLVRCRDGSFQGDTPEFTEVSGLLENTVTIAEDGQSFVVELDGYDFEAGDIMQIDASIVDSATDPATSYFTHVMFVLDRSDLTYSPLYPNRTFRYDTYAVVQQSGGQSIIPIQAVLKPQLDGTKIVLNGSFSFWSTPAGSQRAINSVSVKVRR